MGLENEEQPQTTDIKRKTYRLNFDIVGLLTNFISMVAISLCVYYGIETYGPAKVVYVVDYVQIIAHKKDDLMTMIQTGDPEKARLASKELEKTIIATTHLIDHFAKSHKTQVYNKQLLASSVNVIDITPEIQESLKALK